MSKAKSKSYIRPHDGATMLEVEPHQYVNAKVFRLQGRLPDGHQHDETAAASGAAINHSLKPHFGPQYLR